MSLYSAKVHLLGATVYKYIFRTLCTYILVRIQLVQYIAVASAIPAPLSLHPTSPRGQKIIYEGHSSVVLHFLPSPPRQQSIQDCNVNNIFVLPFPSFLGPQLPCLTLPAPPSRVQYCCYSFDVHNPANLQILQSRKMSAIVEKTADVAVTDVTNTLANTTISDKPAEDAKPAINDAGHQSANEGRRLYIGNLAYATQEEQLKEFFNGYLVYVFVLFSRFLISN